MVIGSDVEGEISSEHVKDSSTEAGCGC
jgi:hypothetical protein